MNWSIILQILNGLIVAVGIPVVVNMLIGIGKKLQLIDSLDGFVRKELYPDLKNIRERFIVVEDRVNSLWKDKFAPANSPRKLNHRGETILEGSGIKEIIDLRKDEFLVLLRSKHILNPYDAEQCILSIVNDLKSDASLINALKTSAFSVGADIDAVLLVGGIYLRDRIFPDIGFSIDDLDKPKVS